MKICLLGPFPPLRGGIAQFNSRLAKALGEAGHRIEKVGFRTLYPRLLFPGRTQFEEAGSASPVEGVPLLRPTAPLTWPRTRRIISSMACDAAVVQWWHPFFAPCLSACLPRNIPAAAVCHNLLPHEGFPFAQALTERFMRSMRTLVVHGGTDVDRASSFGGRVVTLFHPLYDQYLEGAPSRAEARRRLGIPEGRTVLLFFGLVRRYKGLDILIEAMKLLPDDTVLLAAGENYGDERELAEAASTLGDRFERHDRFIPDREVGVFFRAADIVVLPYRTATQSGVAQIALAFGKPMVVTDVGSLGETVQPGVTGEIAERPDAGLLAGAVMKCGRIVSDPGHGDRVAVFAARFSWKTYAEALVNGLA